MAERERGIDRALVEARLTDDSATWEKVREALACAFVPTHEPWSCSVHPAGYRTALDQTECSIVLGEGTLAELGRDIRAYGDYRAQQAREAATRAVTPEVIELRTAVERLRNVSQPREFDLLNGAFDRRTGWNDAIDAVLGLLAGDKAEAPRPWTLDDALEAGEV